MDERVSSNVGAVEIQRDLGSPRADERAVAAVTAGQHGMFEFEGHLRELLGDKAPFVWRRGDREVVIEVRASALEGLEALYAARGRPLDLGIIEVRKAMPVAEAMERAEKELRRLGGNERARLTERAARDVRERSAPEPADEPALHAFRLLQLLDLVEYRREAVNPETWSTPLQDEIRASQVRSHRPKPHLRITAKGQPDVLLGFLYRSPETNWWTSDLSEGHAAFQVEDEIQWAMFGIRSGNLMPNVRHTEDGEPVRSEDGAFVFAGDLDLNDSELDPLVLRSVAALIAEVCDAAVVR